MRGKHRGVVQLNVTDAPRVREGTERGYHFNPNHHSLMKKLILLLVVIAVGLPMAAMANHLDGSWGGYGSNYISFGIGNQQRRFSHSGNVQFFDDRGGPVDYHTLRPGHPITVDYSGNHGHEVVNRVIVHQRSGGRHHGH